MPNKYYLREDRKAVKPEIKEPKPERFGNWNRAVDNWEQHIKSLPALDVDQDYLKRLSPGWFEGVEEYRITSTKGWVKTHKAMYDRFPDIQKQVLIVAPQPVAEKAGMRWVKASERLPQAGKPFFIRSVHTKSGGMMWGEEISKMEELENVEWLDDLPATPQPVTGEDCDDVGDLQAALEKCIEERKAWCAKAMEAANDRLNWQNRATAATKQINELGLLVHRLCKQIEDNFANGTPLDLKKVEEARNYIIKSFSAKNILR